MKKREIQKLEKNIHLAIEWIVSEGRFLNKLKIELMVIENNLRRAIRLIRYLVRAERRAHHFEQLIGEEITNLTERYKEQTGHELTLAHIIGGFREVLKELKIEDANLVKFLSYDGILQEELSQEKLEHSLYEKIKEDNPKKAEQTYKNILEMVHNFSSQIKVVEEWIKAIVITLNKATKISKNLENNYALYYVNSKGNYDEDYLLGADLRGEKDLQGFDFSRKNISMVRFDNSDLKGANFAQTKMKKTSFVGADLQGAIFSPIGFMRKVNFDKAIMDVVTKNRLIAAIKNLIKKKAEEKSVEGQNFMDTPEFIIASAEDQLRRLDKIKIINEKVNIEMKDRTMTVKKEYRLGPGSKLQYADLSHRDLSGKDLSGANLSGVWLKKSNCEKTKFVRANLTGAKIEQCNCYKADFTSANVSKVYFAGSDLRKAKFLGITKSEGAEFINYKGDVNDMRGTDFRNSDFSKAKFTEGKVNRRTKFDKKNPPKLLFSNF